MFIAALAASLAAAALQTAAPAPAGPVLHRYDAPALSPDGRRIATVDSSSVIGGGGPPAHGVVTIRSNSGEISATADPCPACRYGDTAWSPDSGTLAFIASDAKAGTATLYVLENDRDLYKPRIVTTVTGLAAHPRWSADGRTIALLAVPNPHKLVGATQAGAAQTGEIGVASAIDEQRIATVPLSGGDLTLVSPPDTWVYEFDWAPDGGFVATAAKGDGDNNWWTAKLEAFGLDGSERVIAAPKMQMNFPRVAPDGKSVLFIGGLMSDFGSVGGDIYSLSLIHI